jgi:hypothetical protein
MLPFTMTFSPADAAPKAEVIVLEVVLRMIRIWVE